MIKQLIPGVLVFLLALPPLATAGGRSHSHGRRHFSAHKRHDPFAAFKYLYRVPRPRGFLYDHSGRYGGHRYYFPRGTTYRALRQYHYDEYYSYPQDFHHDGDYPHYK